MSGVFDKVLGFFRKPRQILSYKYDTGLLWKVSNGQSKAYILGAIYFGKRGCFPMPVTIDEAFEDSQVLVVQVEEEGNTREYRRRVIHRHCLLPVGTPLEKVVSRRTWRALQEYNVDLKKHEYTRPWFLATVIEFNMLKSLGYSEKYGMSKYYKKHAKLLGMPVKGLEKMGPPAAAFLTAEEEEQFLYTMLQIIKEIEDRNELWFHCWRKGAVLCLERMSLDYTERFPEAIPYYEAAIWNKCGPMADKVEGYLNEGPTHFVIMSDFHALGEKGVINLLRERGYQVEQVGVDGGI